ncbi:MAG TPA: hypothetical protein VMT86_05260 [Bryobacteraceae bacterium]|nr:hypothetical protein [Bryobacteraceae bacterium]
MPFNSAGIWAAVFNSRSRNSTFGKRHRQLSMPAGRLVNITEPLKPTVSGPATGRI